MNTRCKLVLSVLALALAACSDERGRLRDGRDAGAGAGVEDELEPDSNGSEGLDEDAGAAPVAPVPLTLWVDDLIDHHTTNFAEPDTVDDKVITDDTDEGSFDKYLP